MQRTFQKVTKKKKREREEPKARKYLWEQYIASQQWQQQQALSLISHHGKVSQKLSLLSISPSWIWTSERKREREKEESAEDRGEPREEKAVTLYVEPSSSGLLFAIRAGNPRERVSEREREQGRERERERERVHLYQAAEAEAEAEVVTLLYPLWHYFGSPASTPSGSVLALALALALSCPFPL